MGFLDKNPNNFEFKEIDVKGNEENENNWEGILQYFPGSIIETTDC